MTFSGLFHICHIFISGLSDLITLNMCHSYAPQCTGTISFKFGFGQPIRSIQTYNVFTADTLRHAVALTFDPSTVNVCSVSAVT